MNDEEVVLDDGLVYRRRQMNTFEQAMREIERLRAVLKEISDGKPFLDGDEAAALKSLAHSALVMTDI